MFDLRYHVASLAAVFIALILGILIGVGLSGSGVTNDAELKALREQLDDRRAERDAARDQVGALKKRSRAFDVAYPAVVQDRLVGKRVALLYVGEVDGGVAQAVEDTLRDAGARPPVRMIALQVPLDVDALDNTLASAGPQFERYVGDEKLDTLASALAHEFVSGGETPLWKTLGRELVAERAGSMRPRADAVVVARSAAPQQGLTMRFLRALYTALATSDVPAVGVEETGATPSTVGPFADRGLSTVDDVDLNTGRAALALLLGGADSGNYGVGDDAEAILPAPGG